MPNLTNGQITKCLWSTNSQRGEPFICIQPKLGDHCGGVAGKMIIAVVEVQIKMVSLEMIEFLYQWTHNNSGCLYKTKLANIQAGLTCPTSGFKGMGSQSTSRIRLL